MMRRFVICAFGLAVAAPALGAYTDFRDLPYVYAQDPSRFAQLAADANSRTVRIALLGDSQETAPGG